MSEHISIPLEFEGEALEGVLVAATAEVRPTVILIPTVMGVSALELGFAERLVGAGYHGFVADLFGTAFRGAAREVMFGEMNRLRDDRESLRRRLLAVVDQVRGLAQVDGQRIAVIGYCFGGQCALDVARAGADVAGVASFHGLFDPPGLPPQPIRARVVAFHGWDDPMVPPEAVIALGQELTEAGADWQIHAYGNVRHGFTNPNADAMGLDAVRFNAAAARRSWTSLMAFLEEIF